MRRSAFVMSITPFDQHGTLDEAAFRRHLRRLREAGAGVYIGSSASGEGFSLTPDELDRMLAIAVEELKGQVNVRAMGVEVRHAGQMIDFLKLASRHALDAVHVFGPEMGHAAKPSPRELEHYFSTVIETTSQPVVLSSYHTLGFNLPVTLLERLLNRFPQIIGFFYGGSDIRYLSDVIERLASRIEVHCAGPYNALTTLSLGGHGCMGHEGNLAPTMVTELIAAFEARDQERLRRAYALLLAVYRIHYQHGGPVRAMKPLLNALGLPGGTVRLPRMAISDDELAQVLNATLKLNIPGLPTHPVSGAAHARGA